MGSCSGILSSISVNPSESVLLPLSTLTVQLTSMNIVNVVLLVITC